MVPEPNKAEDDTLHCPVSNPNCLFEDVSTNDFDDLLELGREIQSNISEICPIFFGGSFWNEDSNSNINSYLSGDLIGELDSNQEEISESCANITVNIPTVHQDHCYTRNRTESNVNDDKNITNEEKIENINIDEEIENINLNTIENFDFDESDTDVDVWTIDDHIHMTENVLTIVNSEIANRPRRGRPKCINYTGLSRLAGQNSKNTRRRIAREDRENTRKGRTKGKKRMDEKTRAIHNTKERDRRNALKQSLASLAEEIPNLPNRKPMNLVLRKAVDYINKLKNESNKCDKEFTTAKNLNKKLLKRFAKLQHRRKKNAQTSNDNCDN